MLYTDVILLFFFFNDTATTEIYSLSLHDSLPIFRRSGRAAEDAENYEQRKFRPLRNLVSIHGYLLPVYPECADNPWHHRDRKSTRLNSSHGYISYAVFCLKKKKTTYTLSTHH